MLYLLALIMTTPGQADAAISRASAGDTVVFAPGNYGAVTIRDKVVQTPIHLRLAGASLNLVIRNSSGLVLHGGNYSNPGRMGALITHSRNISLIGGRFNNSRRGVIIDRSKDVQVVRSSFEGLTSDGVIIGLSQRIRIIDNVCREFVTQPPEHPDCIQAWSRPEGITSDILIARNIMRQPSSQGIFFGNHVRNGIDDGGFDRVTIQENIVVGRDHPQGIALYDCRDCLAFDNRVSSMPGGKHLMNFVIKRGSVRQARNLLNGKPMKNHP